MKEKLTEGRSIEFKNLFLLSLVSLLEGLQVLIVTVFIFSFIPLTSDLKSVLLPEMVSQLRPERDIFFYRIFVIATMCIQAGSLLIFRKQLNKEEFCRDLGRFAVAEMILLCVIFFALFKITVYGSCALTKNLFYFALSAAFLQKMFWRQVKCLISRLNDVLAHEKVYALFAKICDVLMPLLIFLIVYIPNRAGAIAKIFTNDRLYHFDSFIMAPAWAFLKGLTLNVDVFSQYSVGMPVLIGTLSRVWKDISYENILLTMICLSVIYFVLCYVLLRVWLKDPLLAILGVLMIFKFQMFHYDASDFFLWKHPSGSVVRHFFDMVFFILLWLFTQSSDRKFLLFAAICSGVSLFYMTDTGVYQLITLYAYLFLLLAIPHCRNFLFRSKKSILGAPIYLLLPLATAFLLLWSIVGNHIFQFSFWRETSQYVRLTAGGFDALPLLYGLEQKFYYAFFLACVIIFVYVLTMIFVTTLAVYKKVNPEKIFIVAVSIYGLCLLHYYMFRSGPMSYRGATIPFVFIMCFGIDWILQNYDKAFRHRILAGAVALASFALLTSHAFIRYPNFLNLMNNAFGDEQKHMAEDLTIDADAQFIKSLTSNDERVALISSFEVAMLMKADRKPFFYYFPLLNPRSLYIKDFGGTKLTTTEQLAKTIHQLDTSKPGLVFIEKKLFNGEIPRIYYEKYSALTILVKYLHEHYEPAQKGYFLMALKRKTM